MNAIDHERYKSMAVPIADLMASPNGLNPEYMNAFKTADVVLGLDVDRENQPALCWSVFAGRGWMQEIIHGKTPVNLKMFFVSYRQSTDQLEQLCACCQAHRHECDYR